MNVMAINNMMPQAFALFKCPHENVFTRIEQFSKPRTFQTLEDIPTTGGYLIAPFVCSEECPILFIEPDATSVSEIEPTADVNDIGFVDDALEERKAYSKAFKSVSEMFDNKVIKKLVLSRRLNCKLSSNLDAEKLFLRACTLRPNNFVALWHTPVSGTWLVATPEPLLERTNSVWHTVALAGTLPWNDNIDVLWDNKNKEEQVLVKDFIATTLKPVTENMDISPTYSLRSGNIQHLCNDITFTLKDNVNLCQVLQTLHPTPAVCGLPREKSKSAILEIEPTSRFYYAGFSGPYLLEEQTMLYVSLRCMQLNANMATLYAGGGIMPESKENEEWEETVRKMATMRQLIKRN